jgi:DNA invertase Pin-like site-specific DNA recombinase
MAEDEWHRIVKQANKGRVAARKRGAKFGHKPKLTDHQQAEAIKRMAGESCRSIGKTMGVHHTTIARLAG